MFKGTKVFDVHGHVSAPGAARNWIMSGFASGAAPQNPFRRAGGGNRGGGGLPGQRGPASDPLGPEAILESNKQHVQYMDDRNIDVQVIGPRPFTMMGWMPRHLLKVWCEFTNDTIWEQCKNFPDRFLGVSMLPQIAEAPDLSNCVPEFTRNVKEYGFVGTYLSPDPDGRHNSPGMHDPYWDPIYNLCEEWDVPVFVHGTNCLDPRISHIPGNYQLGFVTETFLASRILAYSDVFERHPGLRITLAHAGGALDRFIDASFHRIPRGKDLTNNLFFDTCVYDEEYLALAIRQWGVKQIVFGTEAPGSGGAVRPETGKTSDDLLPIIDQNPRLSEEDKITIIHDNPLKVFPAFAKVPDSSPAKA